MSPPSSSASRLDALAFGIAVLSACASTAAPAAKAPAVVVVAEPRATGELWGDADDPTVVAEPALAPDEGAERGGSSADAPDARPEVATVPIPTAPAAAPTGSGAPPPPQGSSKPGSSTRLLLPGPIEFDTGTAALRPQSDSVLMVALRELRARPAITKLRIEVHTDSMGSAAANERLSAERALSVARWFVVQGIGCRRLVAVGFGETRPLASNSTEDGRRQNRRTELHIAALNGRPVEKMPLDGGGRVAGDPCR